jgi:hypothetical protein
MLEGRELLWPEPPPKSEKQLQQGQATGLLPVPKPAGIPS